MVPESEQQLALKGLIIVKVKNHIYKAPFLTRGRSGLQSLTAITKYTSATDALSQPDIACSLPPFLPPPSTETPIRIMLEKGEF